MFSRVVPSLAPLLCAQVRRLVMRTKGATTQVKALYQGDLTKIYEVGSCCCMHTVSRTKQPPDARPRVRSRVPRSVPVLQGLDILGAVPWRLNVPVLEVVRTLWENGGGVAGLPARSRLPLPEPLPEGTQRSSPEVGRVVVALAYCVCRSECKKVRACESCQGYIHLSAAGNCLPATKCAHCKTQPRGSFAGVRYEVCAFCCGALPSHTPAAPYCALVHVLQHSHARGPCATGTSWRWRRSWRGGVGSTSPVRWTSVAVFTLSHRTSTTWVPMSIVASCSLPRCARVLFTAGLRSHRGSAAGSLLFC